MMARASAARWLLVAAVGLSMALAMSACGGSSSSSNGGGDASSSSGSSAQGAAKEPSAEFAGKGKNGELASAGAESTEEEREEASKVVEASLAARAAGDWEGQCETLTPGLVEGLEAKESNGILKKSCAEALAAFAKQAVPGSLKSPMTEPLAALRVNGTRAFAFFHGGDGSDYVIPLERQGAEWKVASLQVQKTP